MFGPPLSPPLLRSCTRTLIAGNSLAEFARPKNRYTFLPDRMTLYKIAEHLLPFTGLLS